MFNTPDSLTWYERKLQLVCANEVPPGGPLGDKLPDKTRRRHKIIKYEKIFQSTRYEVA